MSDPGKPKSEHAGWRLIFAAWVIALGSAGILFAVRDANVQTVERLRAFLFFAAWPVSVLLVSIGTYRLTAFVTNGGDRVVVAAMAVLVQCYAYVRVGRLLVWLFVPQHWDGIGQWTFRVTVLDQITRQPVKAATAGIVVSNECLFGAIETYGVEPEAVTNSPDAAGTCLIHSRFACYGYSSKFKSTAFVNFLHRNLRVQAPGYRPYDEPLKNHVDTPMRIETGRGTTDVHILLLPTAQQREERQQHAGG